MYFTCIKNAENPHISYRAIRTGYSSRNLNLNPRTGRMTIS